jgi:hypothetical protein
MLGGRSADLRIDRMSDAGLVKANRLKVGGFCELIEGRNMQKNVLFVDLGIDATNDDILDQMRKMKSCRENRTYSNLVCTVRGFSDDKRNLFEIPEVRAFCRRVVNLGFISYLDFTTTVPPRSGSADAAIGPMKRKGIPCRKSTASRTRRPRRIGSDIKMKRPGASTSCLRRSCDPLCNFGIAHHARSISLEKLLQ